LGGRRAGRRAGRRGARGYTGPFQVEGLQGEDGLTLFLYGDLTAESVPHLQAVLDGLILHESDRVLVDLSAVGQLSAEALSVMASYGGGIGAVALRSAGPAKRADPMDLALPKTR